MIGAAQQLRPSLAIGQQPRSAVPADIVKSPQQSVPPAQREQLPSRDIDGQIVSGLCDPGNRAQHLPVPAENGLPFRLENAGIDVVARVEISEQGSHAGDHNSR
jgi:hypothetical protein